MANLKDFWRRLKPVIDYSKRNISPTPHHIGPGEQTEGPYTIEEKALILETEGRNRRKVWIRYLGLKSAIESRYIWPMSWKDTNVGMLLYAWCELHSRIHNFRLERIVELTTTNLTFETPYEPFDYIR